MDAQTVPPEDMQPRKYLFDLTFDNGQNKKAAEREKPKPTFTQEQLDAEKQTSFEQGKQEGQRLMAEDQQQYTNTLLSEISQHLTHVIEQSAAEWDRQVAQLQQLAQIIMRKIMPSYVEKYGLEEIEAIIAKILSDVGREPRLVFRINENLFDTINDKISAIARQQAYAGKVVVLGDPALGPSDCRIEWADGGIERNVQAIWHAIENVMSRVIPANVLDETPPAQASVETTTPETPASEPQTASDGLPPQEQPTTHAGEPQ